MKIAKYFIILLPWTVVVACSASENRKEDVSFYLVALDSIMKVPEPDLVQVNVLLADLKPLLVLSFNDDFSDNVGATFARTNWNPDSSVVMIILSETYGMRVKKETILHINDSVLFIKRFAIGPALDTPAYFFVESYDYLTPSQNIKTIVRMKNLQVLSDSIDFKDLPFKDVSSKAQDHYDSELDYVRAIFRRD